MMMLLQPALLLKGVASFHTRKAIDTSYNAYIDDRRHRHIRVERKTMRLNLVEQQIFFIDESMYIYKHAHIYAIRQQAASGSNKTSQSLYVFTEQPLRACPLTRLTDRHKAQVSLERHDSNIKEISYRPLQPWGESSTSIYIYIYTRIHASVSNDDDDDVLKKILYVRCIAQSSLSMYVCTTVRSSAFY
jgi:hypothetical protein